MNFARACLLSCLLASIGTVQGQDACGELTLQDLIKSEQCIARYPTHRDCDSLRNALQVRMLAMRQIKPEGWATMDPWAGVKAADCLDRSGQAEWWFALGVFYMEQLDFTSAMGAFEEVMALSDWEEHVGKAQIMKAICESELGQHDAALASCASAIARWGEGEIPPLYGLNLAHVLQAAGWHHTALNWLNHSMDRALHGPTDEVPGLQNALAEAILESAFHAGRCDVAERAIGSLELPMANWERLEQSGILQWLALDCQLAFQQPAGKKTPAFEGNGPRREAVHDVSVAIQGPVSVPFFAKPPSGLLFVPVLVFVAWIVVRTVRRSGEAVTLEACFRRMPSLILEGQTSMELSETWSQIERRLPAALLSELNEDPVLERLTERELEVLQLAMVGMMPKQIAVELELSPKYIYNIFSELRQKLDLDRDQSLQAWREQEAEGKS